MDDEPQIPAGPDRSREAALALIDRMRIRWDCTAEIALKFLEDPTVRLEGFVLIDIDAAEILSVYDGDELWLSNLVSLRPSCARALAQFSGQYLNLSGLEWMPVEVARELAAYGGAELSLSGVKELTAEAAAHLASRRPPHVPEPCRTLWLDGLQSITPDVARALADAGGIVSLNGLETIDAETARNLIPARDLLAPRTLWYIDHLKECPPGVLTALYKIPRPGALVLDELTELSPALAEELAMLKYLSVSFRGITSLSIEAARALRGFHGFLKLQSLQELPEGIAAELGQLSGSLAICGLTGLSDESARLISQFNGKLILGQLSEINRNAARSLTAHRGGLQIMGLKNLEPQIAGILLGLDDHLTLGLHSITKEVASVLAMFPNDLSLDLSELTTEAAASLCGRKAKLMLTVPQLSDEVLMELAKWDGLVDVWHNAKIAQGYDETPDHSSTEDTSSDSADGGAPELSINCASLTQESLDRFKAYRSTR